MTTPDADAPQPRDYQPRDIALEQETPEQAAAFEAESEPDDAPSGRS